MCPLNTSLDRPSSVFVVGPAYNEEEAVLQFLRVLETVLGEQSFRGRYSPHVIVVNDGSTDGTDRVLREELSEARRNSPIQLTYLKLSRNFGHQAAIQAGLERAFQISKPGDFFVVLDTDLQHPPALIPDIVKRLDRGAAHVQMIRTDEASGQGWLKRWTSRAFYSLFSKLSDIPLEPGSADFRGLNRGALQAYLSLRERGRFNRGLFRWIGFETEKVFYAAAERTAGQTKYSARRMARLAFTGLTYFSSRPLIYGLGAIVFSSFLFCAAYLIFEVVRLIQGQTFVLGWTSIIFFVTFWGGILALSQLLIAVYVSRVFDEVKARPISWVETIESTQDSDLSPDLSNEPKGTRRDSTHDSQPERPRLGL